MCSSRRRAASLAPRPRRNNATPDASRIGNDSSHLLTLLLLLRRTHFDSESDAMLAPVPHWHVSDSTSESDSELLSASSRRQTAGLGGPLSRCVTIASLTAHSHWQSAPGRVELVRVGAICDKTASKGFASGSQSADSELPVACASHDGLGGGENTTARCLRWCHGTTSHWHV